MIRASTPKQQSAFSQWLRTGRLPPAPNPGGIELKFNPWHDPEDGKFTFAGSGRHYGAGGSSPANGASSRQPRIGTKPRVEAERGGQRVQSNQNPAGLGATEARFKPMASRRGDRKNPATEFVGGVGEGLYDVAEGVVTGAYSALTTNPATTARNTVLGIAGTIDAAIATEEKPARVQVSRAARAIANAPARDIGKAVGAVAGNTALTVVPGSAVAKVSAIRALRKARPRKAYPPPQFVWVKENLGRDSPAKRYNDSAPNARPGMAPALMRTMADGSKRGVKFDSIPNEYPLDRKRKIVNLPRARAQAIRQSDVLSQHDLIGTWEVPTHVQRIKALEMLNSLNIKNIKVRVVKE